MVDEAGQVVDGDQILTLPGDTLEPRRTAQEHRGATVMSNPGWTVR